MAGAPTTTLEITGGEQIPTTDGVKVGECLSKKAFLIWCSYVLFFSIYKFYLSKVVKIYYKISKHLPQTIRVDTLRELKKLVGLNDDVFFYEVFGWLVKSTTLFFGHPTILFCISVIFTAFLFYWFTSVGSRIFLSTLTNVNPFDFEDLLERAESIFFAGDTIVGYCFDRDKRLGLALAVDGKGLLVHQFYSVLSWGLNILVPSSHDSLS